MPTWVYKLYRFNGDIVQNSIRLATVDQEVAEQWIDESYDDCISVEAHMLDDCEHLERSGGVCEICGKALSVDGITER